MLTSNIVLSDGKNYKINTSHKIGLQWWLYVDTYKDDDSILRFIAFKKFLDIDFTNNDNDYSILLNWLQGYKKIVINKDVNNCKFFDIKKDYAMLWASIYESFQIDIDVVVMHWHKFLAIFDIVVSGYNIKNVIAIRNYKPNKNDSKEYIENMNILKSLYSLDDNVIVNVSNVVDSEAIFREAFNNNNKK